MPVSYPLKPARGDAGCTRAAAGPRRRSRINSHRSKHELFDDRINDFDAGLATASVGAVANRCIQSGGYQMKNQTIYSIN